MKLNYKLLKRLLIFLAVLTPVAFGLRLYTYWKEMDAASYFFRDSGIICSVFNGICLGVFFICLLFSFSKKGVDVSASEGDASPRRKAAEDLLVQDEELFDAEEAFPQYFHKGFAKKACVWNGTLSAFACLLPGFGFLCYALSFLMDKDNLRDLYVMVFAALSLLSGAFFLLSAFRNSFEKSKFFAFFALVPALWATLRMIVEYRDLTRFINKSLYVGQFLFVLSILIFFLYQGQILLGEESLSRPNSYAFSAVAAVFLGVVARLPVLIALIGDQVRLDLVDASSLLMDIAITLFIAVKLASAAKRH